MAYNAFVNYIRYMKIRFSMIWEDWIKRASKTETLEIFFFFLCSHSKRNPKVVVPNAMTFLRDYLNMYSMMLGCFLPAKCSRKDNHNFFKLTLFVSWKVQQILSCKLWCWCRFSNGVFFVATREFWFHSPKHRRKELRLNIMAYFDNI